MILRIGIDDTDSSLKGGCTTYIGAYLVEHFSQLDVKFLDYPYLIRLNPNIPYRTRGNAAISFTLEVSDDNVLKKVKDLVVETVEALSAKDDPKTNPGVVFYYEDKVNDELRRFYKMALTSLVNLDDAKKLIKKYNMETYTIKEGRGIIGGIASIGADLTQDYTFELLAYRSLERKDKERKIDEFSVKIMDTLFNDVTFNNYDYNSKRLLIAPHGPDPVIYGIRGEWPFDVYLASRSIQLYESVERWVIYKTNQGTDAHIIKRNIKNLKVYDTALLEGTIVEDAKMIMGGHVFFKISDGTGEVLCAVFSPTGNLNQIARNLAKGDKVRVYGSLIMKKGKASFNVEKIEILELAPKFILRNPHCPRCGKTLTSAGKGKGYKCKFCGFKTKEKLEKEKIKVKRNLLKGLYVSDPKAQRHLTKPLKRYNIKTPKSPSPLLDFWHFP
ncbi:MAG: TiaS agmantine-binding domain-containing protein [Candidatus Asgardarchaeia archaeon]